MKLTIMFDSMPSNVHRAFQNYFLQSLVLSICVACIADYYRKKQNSFVDEMIFLRSATDDLFSFVYGNKSGKRTKRALQCKIEVVQPPILHTEN
jgi:hypothetical protein